VVSTDNAVSFG